MNTEHTNGISQGILLPKDRVGFFDELRLPEPKLPTTLVELADEFAMVEAVKNPDVDVPAATLKFTRDGNVEVPNRGDFALTPWTKKQLASRLGITWDRWFEGIDPDLRATEINRRLARDTKTVRLKTNALPGDTGGVGTLRGIVTPSYATVPDESIARAVLCAVGDSKLVRATTTDRTTSYVVQLGKPFHLGGPGRVGDVVGGLLVRNSDVGCASLVVALHLTRLVCTNGMIVSENATIVRRAHRSIDLGGLREKLATGLKDVPFRLQRAGRSLELAGHHSVADVPAALAEVLRDAVVPLRHLPLMMAAYEREPHPTVFGVSQAITLGAQDRKMSAEDRILLERAAGAYVARYGR